MSYSIPFDDSIDVQLTDFAGEFMDTPHDDDGHVPDPYIGVQRDMPVEDDDILVKHDELERSHDPHDSDLPPVDISSSSSSSGSAFISRGRGYAIVIVLFIVNMLNYMDRFTIAGVLKDIKHDFGDISDKSAGLLQTSFICVYMIASPVFGYLGDRYKRKYLMVFGIIFWCLVTLASSFVPGKYFWLFTLFRGLVGMGEASYSTIAPTLIADLFTDDKRKLMLMIFYFAIPVGSGLGYVVGTGVGKLFHDWRYGLRLTPFLGIICVILLLIFVKEPERGAAEGGTHIRQTSWLQDVRALFRNKSFMLSSGGVTCVAFVVGALAFWAPTFMLDAHYVQEQKWYTSPHVQTNEARIGLIFGGITVAAGFIGVALGSETARRYKKRNPRADPLVCAFGLLTCTPFLFAVLYLAKYNAAATWVAIFLGETMLCLNWAVVADILLYVVVPTRRSTAEAIQILMSHLLGDAGSPFLIGQISDSLKPTFHGHNAMVDFTSLQQAMVLSTFVCVIGGGLFLLTAVFVVKDKAHVDRVIADHGYHDVSSLESDNESQANQELLTIDSDDDLIGQDPETADLIGRDSTILDVTIEPLDTNRSIQEREMVT